MNDEVEKPFDSVEARALYIKCMHSLDHSLSKYLLSSYETRGTGNKTVSRTSGIMTNVSSGFQRVRKIRCVVFIKLNYSIYIKDFKMLIMYLSSSLVFRCLFFCVMMVMVDFQKTFYIVKFKKVLLLVLEIQLGDD